MVVADALELLLGEVDVNDLAFGVDSGVGSSGDSHGEVVLGGAKDRLECLDEFALNGSEVELLGPTEKVGAVVAEVDAKTKSPANRKVDGAFHEIY